MNVACHFYNQHFRVSGRSHRGALLKVKWDDGITGYADCHPWPELGDSDLHQHMESLKKGVYSSLLERSLTLARADGEARQKNVSLLEEQTIPASHYLITDPLCWSQHTIEEAVEKGYTHIKVKLGTQLAEQTQILVDWMERFSSAVLWRLDFNAQLTASSFSAWEQKLPAGFWQAVDCVEDPVTKTDWPHMNSPSQPLWAVDRVMSVEEAAAYGCTQFVVKPALWVPSRDKKGDDSNWRYIFTTNMGHPLGQAAAMWEAARFYEGKPDVCGLQTVHLQQADPFTRWFEYNGPYTKVAPGPGLGFENELENLEWEWVI